MWGSRYEDFLSAVVASLACGPAFVFGSVFSGFVQVGKGYADGENSLFIATDLNATFKLSDKIEFGLGGYGARDDKITIMKPISMGAIIIYGRHNLSDAASLDIEVPRPVFDLFALSAMDDIFPTLGLENSNYTCSAATEAALRNDVPYGLTYRNGGGQISFGLSYFQVDGYDADILSIGLGTTQNQVNIQTAIEYSGNGMDVWRTKLGLSAELGSIRLSGSVFSVSDATDEMLIELSGGTEVSDDLSFEVVVQNAGSEYSFTAGVSFNIAANFDLMAAASTDFSGDEKTYIGLGYRF